MAKIFNVIYELIRKISVVVYSLYYKSLFKGEKNKLRIYGNIVVKKAENITIGNNCTINDYVFLHGDGGIKIADNVTISAYAKIISTSLDTSNWQVTYMEKEHISKEITIGEGTWICSGVTILPGVKITGKGVIVAAGSVLNKDIEEDFVLVGGTPARVIKKLG
ncbi:acyltransferase [Pontibacillus marinus]|uniref:Acetyl transferase n=1 Tax=Pontibacillus marinus BH030004 = DSM 16465 TaxID=1385511 RepID=A0A0A5GIQ5_9BACI|nr:acyltransferase [Pontibacillus marinus]KGX90995.1 acetyl transferase [Pontibacillus marinus BH030004 = DSM 16465]